MDYVCVEDNKEIVEIPLVLVPGEQVAIVVQCGECTKECGNLCKKLCKKKKCKKGC